MREPGARHRSTWRDGAAAGAAPSRIYKDYSHVHDYTSHCIARSISTVTLSINSPHRDKIARQGGHTTQRQAQHKYSITWALQLLVLLRCSCQAETGSGKSWCACTTWPASHTATCSWAFWSLTPGTVTWWPLTGDWFRFLLQKLSWLEPGLQQQLWQVLGNVHCCWQWRRS